VIPGSAPSFTVASAVRSGTGREKSRMSLKFRVAVEIEGASPDTFKIGFEFSDEDGSDFEFYSNCDLPEDVSDKLGDLAVDFINHIGELVLRKMH
jgi:hypothetical protein